MKDKNIKNASIKQEQEKRTEKREERQNARLINVSALIQKYPEEKELFAAYYGKKVVVHTIGGIVDFNPEGYIDVVGAEKFSYDEYIDVQMKSLQKTRQWFATCYDNIVLGFKGCIERKTKDNICFKRVWVEGMYPDGVCFDGKEDHVWMNIAGFEEYQIGDNVCFFAEVYRYVKTGKGKQIDFALRNPENIRKIENYQLPTNEELTRQAIRDIICETCFLSEQCNRVSCLLPKKSIKSK